MPLQKSLTLPNGITCPAAYGVEDWNLHGSANVALVTITWWASKADHDAGRPSIQTDSLNLTLAEQQSGVARLVLVLDSIIIARPEYAGSAIVS